MPWQQSIATATSTATSTSSDDEEDDDEDMLLYMPCWTWQKEFMDQHLPNLTPISIDEKFAYNENTEKHARIVNECYAAPGLYSKIRMTYYDAGENCQVFNSLWYPDAEHQNLPLLGIDLLSFNGKRFLGIVDFQPLYNSEGEGVHDAVADDYEEQILKPIKSKYPFLKGQSMSSKFYDETQFFSKQMLFCRFDQAKIIEEELMPAFQEYVAAHVSMVKSSRSESSSSVVVQDSQEEVLKRYEAYDTYSAVRDPATGLFAAMFGKEWADDFVYDFLFSRSDREEASKAAVEIQAQQAAQRQAQQKQATGNSVKSNSKKPAFAVAR